MIKRQFSVSCEQWHQLKAWLMSVFYRIAFNVGLAISLA